MVHPLLAAFVSNEVFVSAELCYLCDCFVAKLWQLVIQWCNGMQSWVFVTQIEQINSMLSKFTELKCKWVSYIWMKTIFKCFLKFMDLFHLHVHRYKKIFFGLNKNWLTLSFNQLQVEAKIPVRLSLIINEENFNLYIQISLMQNSTLLCLLTTKLIPIITYSSLSLVNVLTWHPLWAVVWCPSPWPTFWTAGARSDWWWGRSPSAAHSAATATSQFWGC